MKAYEYKNPVFLHLDLAKFKTEKCTNPVQHDPKKCPFYHHLAEKRRSQRDHFYVKSMCPNKDDCSNEHCSLSNNYVEQIYHSDSYKKKYCKDFIEKASCKYEEYCAMAHSDCELKITPLHLLSIDKNFLLFSFKSEFCPFSKISHDRFKCVYAHNWQDFKRPFSESIKPVACKAWDKNKEILEYEQGCERGFDCASCHGWKELEYHLANFKRHPCQKARQCERKEVCSFVHPGEETEPTKNNEFFHPVSKNTDYGSVSTTDYLQLIDVSVNLTPSSTIRTGQGEDSTINFKSKPIGGSRAAQEEHDPEEELGFVARNDQGNDSSKYPISEKLIVRESVRSNERSHPKSYFSEKLIVKSSLAKDQQPESQVRQGNDRHSSSNSYVNFEKNKRRGMDAQIQEKLNESSSPEDTMAM